MNIDNNRMPQGMQGMPMQNTMPNNNNFQNPMNFQSNFPNSFPPYNMPYNMPNPMQMGMNPNIPQGGFTNFGMMPQNQPNPNVYPSFDNNNLNLKNQPKYI